MKKSTKPKRPSGAAQLKALGKTLVQIPLTADELAVIDAARDKDGRSRVNFMTHHATEAAKKLLGEQGG